MRVFLIGEAGILIGKPHFLIRGREFIRERRTGVPWGRFGGGAGEDLAAGSG